MSSPSDQKTISEFIELFEGGPRYKVIKKWKNTLPPIDYSNIYPSMIPGFKEIEKIYDEAFEERISIFNRNYTYNHVWMVKKTNMFFGISSNALISWIEIDGEVPNFPKRLNDLKAASDEVLDEILEAYEISPRDGRSKIGEIYFYLGFYRR